MVKQKVLADGVEAMIGAFLEAGSLEGAWALLAALKILPSPGHFQYPDAKHSDAADTVSSLFQEVNHCPASAAKISNNPDHQLQARSLLVRQCDLLGSTMFP